VIVYRAGGTLQITAQRRHTDNSQPAVRSVDSNDTENELYPSRIHCTRRRCRRSTLVWVRESYILALVLVYRTPWLGCWVPHPVQSVARRLVPLDERIKRKHSHLGTRFQQLHVPRVHDCTGAHNNRGAAKTGEAGESGMCGNEVDTVTGPDVAI